MYSYRNGIFSWLIPIALLLLIVFALYMLFKKDQSKDQGNVKDSTHSALRILNERYAKGELTEEEYRRMKKNLLD